MPRDEPLDLDDEPARPVRRREREPAQSPAVVVWMVAKWGAFGLGCVLGLVAVFIDAIHSGGTAGLACFCAIAARLAQAEEHRAASKA